MRGASGLAQIERLTSTYMYAMQKMACASYSDCTLGDNSTLDKYMTEYGFDVSSALPDEREGSPT